jgi:ribosome-binding protein aMBF1 (putative translation factor)
MERHDFLKKCGAAICGCGVLGKPVTVALEESVLRGGSRCSFRIGIPG